MNGMYNATCPDCGAQMLMSIHSAVAGQMFVACQGCRFSGYVTVTADPNSGLTLIEWLSARCKHCHTVTAKPDAGSGVAYWTCGVCGWVGTQVTPIAPYLPAAAQAAANATTPSVHNHPSTWPATPASSPAPAGSYGLSNSSPWMGPQAPTPAPSPQTKPLPPTAQMATQPLTADVLRDEARERAYALVSGLSEALRELRASDYPTTLIGAYEAQQRALDTLYETLGGRHMGDYAPDVFNVKRDVTQVAMRLILTLCAAERMNERD